MEGRLCAECGTAIRGRSDKKFCSDLCRNSFNNKQNSENNVYVRSINNILRKNRRILEENLQGEKSTVAKQKLLQKGFDFSYYTNQIVTRNNHTYSFCYEFGYLILESGMVLIVKKKME
jgi:hypothetical protein